MPQERLRSLKDAARLPYYSIAVQHFLQRARQSDVVEELVFRGLAQAEAEVVARESSSLLNAEIRSRSNTRLFIGLIFIVVGIGLSVLSYAAAYEGGFFFVFHGAVVYGIVVLVRGGEENDVRDIADEFQFFCELNEAAAVPKPEDEKKRRSKYDY